MALQETQGENKRKPAIDRLTAAAGNSNLIGNYSLLTKKSSTQIKRKSTLKTDSAELTVNK